MNADPRPNGSEAQVYESTAQEPSAREFTLHDYLDVLRRRWKWVVGVGVVAMIAAWFLQRDTVSYPLFSAEVLVQRRAPQGSIGDLGFAGTPRPADQLTSELAILRTGKVLGSVVDSTGLRLRLPDDPTRRLDLFQRVEVSPEAASRQYQLASTPAGVMLRAGGQKVAEADSSSTIVGPGLVLELAEPTRIPDGSVRLEVVSGRDAIRRLEESLKVEHLPRTNLIRIQYSGPDAAHTAVVANALAAAYQEQAAARAREEARRRREFLASRLASVADSLRTAQEALLDFQAASQTVNPQAEGQTLSGQLFRAEEELRQLRNRERSLEDLLENLQSGGREGLRQMMILSSELLPGAADLYRQLQEYEDRRSTLLNVNRRTEQSPDVQLLDSLIAETKAEMRLTAEQALRLVRQDRELAETRVAELRQQVGDVPERNVAFGRLEQRVAAIQKMHDLLAERFYEAQISEAVEAGDIEIVDPAVVPTVPSGASGRQIHPLLALLAGMVVGFAGAVAHEKVNTRIRRAEEVRRFAGVEVIGEIPVLSRAEGGIRPIVSTNGAVASEAFRMLRTNIRFARAEPVKTICITSASPAEGKSVVATNLAIALAQEGKRVLLIDADLRRPVLHTVFGCDRTPGLSDLLVGAMVSEAIRRQNSGVDLIPAGTAVPNPSELVSSSAFRRLVEKARERYDVLVLDTPPVLAVSDASIIASHVDGVILVVRQEQTARDALRGAGEQLRRARASILGVVMNEVRAGGHYGVGYYGYGYGAEESLTERDGDEDTRTRWFSKLPFMGWGR